MSKQYLTSDEYLKLYQKDRTAAYRYMTSVGKVDDLLFDYEFAKLPTEAKTKYLDNVKSVLSSGFSPQDLDVLTSTMTASPKRTLAATIPGSETYLDDVFYKGTAIGPRPFSSRAREFAAEWIPTSGFLAGGVKALTAGWVDLMKEEDPLGQRMGEFAAYILPITLINKFAVAPMWASTLGKIPALAKIARPAQWAISGATYGALHKPEKPLEPWTEHMARRALVEGGIWAAFGAGEGLVRHLISRGMDRKAAEYFAKTIQKEADAMLKVKALPPVPTIRALPEAQLERMAQRALYPKPYERMLLGMDKPRPTHRVYDDAFFVGVLKRARDQMARESNEYWLEWKPNWEKIEMELLGINEKAASKVVKQKPRTEVTRQTEIQLKGKPKPKVETKTEVPPTETKPATEPPKPTIQKEAAEDYARTVAANNRKIELLQKAGRKEVMSETELADFKRLTGKEYKNPKGQPSSPMKEHYSGLPVPQETRNALYDAFIKGDADFEAIFASAFPMDNMFRKLFVKYMTVGKGQPELYQLARRVMKRRIGAHLEEAIERGEYLKQTFTHDERVLIADIAKGKISPLDVKDQRFVDAAKMVREYLDKWQAEAINVGLLTDEIVNSFKLKYGENYLPRLYQILEQEVAAARSPIYRFGRSMRMGLERFKGRGYTKEVALDNERLLDKYQAQGWQIEGIREVPAKAGKAHLGKKKVVRLWKDVPPERRAELGEITEVAYPTAKGGAQVSHDVEVANFVNEFVASNPEVGRVWVLADDVAKEAYTSTERLRGFVRQKKVIDGETYVKLPSTKKLGKLSDRWVLESIADDLIGWTSAPSEIANVMRWITGGFKYSKVILNPATQFRNFYSNIVLIDQAGFSPFNPKNIVFAADSARIFAAKQSRKASIDFTEAKAEGVFRRTFAQEEVMRSWLNELSGLREGQSMLSAGFNMMKKYARKPAQIYSANEDLFKFILFRHGRHRLGLTPEQAADYAHKWLFDYTDVPRFIDWFRRSPFGSPFITFSYKAIPRMAQNAIAIGKPEQLWRFWKWPLMFSMANEASSRKHGIVDPEGKGIGPTAQRIINNMATQFGLDPKNVSDRERYLLASYLGKQQLLLPWKDAEGRLQYFDLTWILPWGDIAEVGKGVGHLPLPRILEPQHPIFMTLAAYIMNEHPLLKDPIRLQGASRAENFFRMFKYAYDVFAPSLAPEAYGWKNIVGTMHKVEGQPLMKQAILSNVMGLKTRPLDPPQGLSFKQKELQDKIAEIRKDIRNKANQRYFRAIQTGDLPPDEQAKRKRLLQKYIERREKDIQRLQEKFEKKFAYHAERY